MKSWMAMAWSIGLATPIMAQLTYDGCPGALASTDFQMTELFNKNGTSGAASDPGLSEPTRMDVQIVNKDGVYDHSNVYFVERLGNVKFYDGAAKKVTTIGKINTLAQQDNGLMGLVLDPGFDTNRWIYFWYSPKQMIGQNRQLRLTRITLKADNTLDMATEKVLIEFKASKTDTWHSGGPMTFDSYGDLWIGVGNNTLDLDRGTCNVLSKVDSTNSGEWGPSNTASMRGGFLRIHPDNSAKGYSIPAGNFGEYWADQFEKQGKTALAAQYRDPAKVLPEVYVKGERSNFSIAVHPTKRWLAWGTVNWESEHDEFNITNHPIFSGFPYYHGDNEQTCGPTMDPSAPKNTSPLNSGVTDLPPAIAAGVTNLVNVAIGGPIYSFDSNLKSDVKFPPHFNNKWIVGGFGGGLWVITFDTTSMKFTNTLKLDNGLFKSFKTRNYVQALYGKDGALYINNYDGYYNSAINPGVMRVTYTGSCKVPVSNAKAPKPEVYQKIWLSQTSLKVGEQGQHVFSLFDLRGQMVYRAKGDKGAEYRFADLSRTLGLQPGVYVVKVSTDQGEFRREASLF